MLPLQLDPLLQPSFPALWPVCLSHPRLKRHRPMDSIQYRQTERSACSLVRACSNTPCPCISVSLSCWESSLAVTLPGNAWRVKVVSKISGLAESLQSLATHRFYCSAHNLWLYYLRKCLLSRRLAHPTGHIGDRLGCYFITGCKRASENIRRNTSGCISWCYSFSH